LLPTKTLCYLSLKYKLTKALTQIIMKPDFSSKIDMKRSKKLDKI
jgi:hypothetical protein